MKLNNKGFTLVELLLAMAFFSFIILFVTTGFIIVNRAYNKGITVKLIQDEGRGVMEELTRNLRATSSNGVVLQSDCLEISGTIYYWSVPTDSTNANSPKRLYRKDSATCPPTSTETVLADSVSMLDDRVGVQFMEVSNVAGSGTIYSITLILSTNETDLLENPGVDANCSTGAGSQYCDVVSLSTVVSTR